MNQLRKIDIPPEKITSAFTTLLGLAGLGWAGMHSFYSGACAASVPLFIPLPLILAGGELGGVTAPVACLTAHTRQFPVYDVTLGVFVCSCMAYGQSVMRKLGVVVQ